MADENLPDGVEDVTVSDLKSTIKTLRVIHDNVQQHQAYFKQDAVEDIITYLQKKLRVMHKEYQNG